MITLPQKRTRTRSIDVDHEELSSHIVTNLDKDLSDRSTWNEMRIQRYAKFRGWLETKTFPWENASNAHIPFLITEVLRSQDTLHNAILARHPVVESMAIQPANQPKQKDIDGLIDYQIFVEQSGEEIVADLVEQFIQDGVFMAYVPWVRYDETVNTLRIFNPVPDDVSITDAVQDALAQVYAQVLTSEQKDADGFRWEATVIDSGIERAIQVEVYIQEEGGRLELSIFQESRAYDGPVIIPKSVDEWVVPWRSANAQPPSPSNPNGAEHVFLLDYPTLDEIRRLRHSGYYDVVTDEEMESLEAAVTNDPEQHETNGEMKILKDQFEGIDGGGERGRVEEVEGAGKLTRITAFIGWDVNGDELQEQLVVWMIKETRTILRVRYLTETSPADPPTRPLASRSYLNIEGRMYGISLLELLESLHDLLKVTFDQMFDGATIKNLPWFAYRPTSGLNPSTIRISPGSGVPMNDPRNDIFVPQFAQQGEAFGMNMISLLNQFAERASMQGDIQFGRVPAGKSAALRTASGLQSLLAQGDARPERVLRRFFSGFKDIYQIIHELNQRFLPKDKQFRLMEPDLQGNGVYDNIEDIGRISGKMTFTFKAGAFNSDKQVAQQAIQTLMGLIINPLFIQMGIVGPQQIMNLLTDFIKLLQQEPSRYLAQPQQGAATLKITAEEAVSLILGGRLPRGTTPSEGIQQHLQLISTFLGRPEIKVLEQHIKTLFQVYVSQLQGELQQEQQKQQLMQAAQQFQQSVGGQGGQTPGPQGQSGAPDTGPGGNPNVQKNELLDESLPGARGPR